MEQELNEEIIGELTDLFQAFKWLQQLKVDSKGVTDLEGAKCKLLQHIQQKQKASQTRTPNVSVNDIDLLHSNTWIFTSTSHKWMLYPIVNSF